LVLELSSVSFLNILGHKRDINVLVRLHIITFYQHTSVAFF